MKARNFFSLLAVFAALLLIVGVGGFLGLTARSPLNLLRQGGQPLPAAALFVPKQSPIMASVLVEPHRLTDLWRLLAAPDLRSEIQAEIGRLERSLLAGTGLSYGEDIRPWLGTEVTFALATPDIDEASESGQQPGFLWILSCRDRPLAQETLDLYWQQQAVSGSSLVFEQFAGSRLVSARPVSSGPLSTAGAAAAQQLSKGTSQLIGASAIVGSKFVLLASSADVLKQALTAAQSQVSLSRDRGFQAAFAKLPRQRIGMVVVNAPQSLRWLGLTSNSQLLTQGLGDTDDLFERAIFSLQLNRQGIVANTALLAAPGHEFSAYSPSTGLESPGRLFPPETSLAAFGGDLAAAGSAVVKLLNRYGLSTTGLAELIPLPIAFWASSPDIQLSTEWLATDYALGLVNPPNEQSNWALAVETTPGAVAAWQDLDQRAHQQGFSVGSLDIDDHPLVVWSKLSIANGKSPSRYPVQVKTDIAGLRTQMGEYEIASPSITVMDRLLHIEASQALTATSLWKAATDPLSQPNTGYLYVDWPQILPGVLQQFPWLRLVETATQPLLRHLKAVAVTGYESNADVRFGAISLYLSNRNAL